MNRAGGSRSSKTSLVPRVTASLVTRKAVCGYRLFTKVMALQTVTQIAKIKRTQHIRGCLCKQQRFRGVFGVEFEMFDVADSAESVCVETADCDVERVHIVRMAQQIPIKVMRFALRRENVRRCSHYFLQRGSAAFLHSDAQRQMLQTTLILCR